MHDTCVLCHQPLNDVSGERLFPKFKKKASLKPIIKWFILLNIISIITTFLFDIQDQSLSYFLIVATANVYAIALILLSFIPDFWTLKLSKILVLTIIGLLMLTIIIGEVYWLLTFVMPIVLSINTMLYLTITIFKKENSIDDVYHSFFMSILGLVPGILTFTSLLSSFIPSQISVIISLFSLLYLFLFFPKLVIEGIKRRFHI
jgi:hypothetical protein